MKGVLNCDSYVCECSFLVKLTILELGEAPFGYLPSTCFMRRKPETVIEYTGW